MSAARPKRKHHRELAETMAAEGFVYAGVDGRSHLVFRREADGRELHLPASPRSTFMARKIARARARRASAPPR